MRACRSARAKKKLSGRRGMSLRRRRWRDGHYYVVLSVPKGPFYFTRTNKIELLSCRSKFTFLPCALRHSRWYES